VPAIHTARMERCGSAELAMAAQAPLVCCRCSPVLVANSHPKSSCGRPLSAAYATAAAFMAVFSATENLHDTDSSDDVLHLLHTNVLC